MILLPLSYRQEYDDFFKSCQDVDWRKQKIDLLSQRAKIEDRSRILQACAVTVFAAYAVFLTSSLINLPPSFEIFKLSANLIIAFGSGFLFYRWLQPEHFEAKI